MDKDNRLIEELNRIRVEQRNQTTHVRFQHRAIILIAIIVGLLVFGIPLITVLTGGR